MNYFQKHDIKKVQEEKQISTKDVDNPRERLEISSTLQRGKDNETAANKENNQFITQSRSPFSNLNFSLSRDYSSSAATNLTLKNRTALNDDFGGGMGLKVDSRFRNRAFRSRSVDANHSNRLSEKLSNNKINPEKG